MKLIRLVSIWATVAFVLMSNRVNGAPVGLQSPAIRGTNVSYAFTVTPTSLDFGTVQTLTTTALQLVTVTNTGNQVLEGFSVSVSSGDFLVGYQAPNDCTLQFFSLNPGGTCHVAVYFQPQKDGLQNSTLTISANAGCCSSVSQVVTLTGTAIPQGSLDLGIAANGSASATVLAGQTGTYMLTIGGGGIGGTATLTCTGAPPESVCNVPASIVLNSSAATMFDVTVSTTAESDAAIVGHRGPWSSWGWMWGSILIVGFTIPNVRRKNQHIFWRSRWFPILLTVFVVSCGGSSEGSGLSGTPAGTYTLTVTAATSAARDFTQIHITVK